MTFCGDQSAQGFFLQPVSLSGKAFDPIPVDGFFEMASTCAESGL